MLHVHQIGDLNATELAPYRTMKWQTEHRERGIFVAEGEKVVRRLIESELEIISLVLPEKWLKVYEPLIASRTGEIHAYTADKEVLEELTGFSMYQGVLAVGKVPRAITIEEALGTLAKPLLIVAMDGITAAENVGGLVRNCVAFGTQAVLKGENSCSPYLRRAVRVSPVESKPPTLGRIKTYHPEEGFWLSVFGLVRQLDSVSELKQTEPTL